MQEKFSSWHCRPDKTSKGTEELRQSGQPLRVALVGNPNTGKTTLFNALTGLRHRVGNYPGVTVEKRWGTAVHGGVCLEIVDLPGIISLEARSQEETVAHDVLCGCREGIAPPDVIVALADPFHLEKNLYLVWQLKTLGVPLVIALTFMDEARKKQLKLDLAILEKRLGVPVLAVSGLRHEGLEALKERIIESAKSRTAGVPAALPARITPHAADPVAIYRWVAQVLDGVFSKGALPRDFRDKLDAVFLHPVAGPLVLAAIMFGVFQSVFSWALAPMQWIVSLCDWAGAGVHKVVGPTLLADFLSDGVIAGVGSVLAFLPQIFLLFFFIGVLEDTGYLARAAFLLDKIMSKTGLTGKAFLPLFSCFACAVPGIMAMRVIENKKERLISTLVAPLMSCSARIPVYALITAAVIPATKVLGFLNLEAIVFFGMYLLGIAVAVLMALLFKVRLPSCEPSHFFLELPSYRMPYWKTLLIHVWERSSIFIKRAGSIILLFSIVLWILVNFPRPAAVQEHYAKEAARVEQSVSDPAQARALQERITHEKRAALLKESIAGKIGRWMEPAIKPLGFNWKVGIGILASFGQREVFVSTLAILYNVESGKGGTAGLQQVLQKERDPVTGRPVYPPLVGISILVFFVLACQCISTLVVARRETGSWWWPVFMFAYMTTLAYLASLMVFQGGKLLGFGS